MSGFPAANASPCIVAMPIRSPVNEPGPVATANTSIVRSAMPARSSERHEIARQVLGMRVRRVVHLLAHDDAVAGERTAS